MGEEYEYEYLCRLSKIAVRFDSLLILPSCVWLNRIRSIRTHQEDDTVERIDIILPIISHRLDGRLLSALWLELGSKVRSESTFDSSFSFFISLNLISFYPPNWLISLPFSLMRSAANGVQFVELHVGR